MPIPDSAIPVELRDRYGLPRPKTGLVVAGLLIAALVAGLMGFISHYVLTHQVVGRMISFTVISPSRVNTKYYIAHAPAGPVTCVLRAQDVHHVDVAYAYVVSFVPDNKSVTVTYPLTTSGTANIAEVLACGAGTTPPQAPAPAFYPGQPAPSQIPPGRAP